MYWSDKFKCTSLLDSTSFLSLMNRWIVLDFTFWIEMVLLFKIHMVTFMMFALYCVSKCRWQDFASHFWQLTLSAFSQATNLRFWCPFQCSCCGNLLIVTIIKYFGKPHVYILCLGGRIRGGGEEKKCVRKPEVMRWIQNLLFIIYI